MPENQQSVIMHVNHVSRHCATEQSFTTDAQRPTANAVKNGN